VVVLGAGLAGLSAALELGGDCRVLEKRDVPGGLADTVEERGFRFDRTGHLLHLSDPGARDLVMELLGDQLVRVERRARVFSSGAYTHYPFQANLHGLPPKVTAECLGGFIEAYVERRGGRAAAGTFEEFILSNFGEGIARHFMIPYNRKLWGVHPREITSAWCDRFVPTPTLEEVVDGTVGLAQERLGYNASFLYPKRGIGALAGAMAARIGSIEHGASPTAIDFRKRRLRLKGEWVPYRALISSIPLDRLARLLVGPPGSVAAAADRLRCTRLRYLDVALDRPPGTDHHWSYVPEREYPFYRVGSYSSFSPAMAPRGKGSLYVELASRAPVKLERIMPGIVSGLSRMGIISRESDILFVRPRTIAHAYVVYDGDRARAADHLLGWLANHRIFSIGRYGRWEYAAMENAIVQGIEAARTTREL
jgi:protoporphyrinogen oxidase